MGRAQWEPRPWLWESQAPPGQVRERTVLLAAPQAKLPNLKEVDVRYTEAW